MSSLDFDLDTRARVTPLADAEPAAELLQRRWFAAAAAAKSLEAECEVLLEVLEISRQAWRAARAQLARLETLRDTLGDQLAAAHEPCADAAPSYEEMSAA